MSSVVKTGLRSRFVLWVGAAILSSVYLFSFSASKFTDGDGSFFDRVTSAVSIPNLSLGIDLQGGTRFVLNVDIDKAIENKLAESVKAFEKAFKKAKTPMPTGRSLDGKAMVLNFSSTVAASSAYDIIKKKFEDFSCKRSDTNLTVKLSGGATSRIKNGAVEQTVHVLRTRLDTVDVRGLTVTRHGDSKVVVQLPGVDDVDKIKATIMRAARLEFKIVDKQAYSKDALLEQYEGILPPDKMLVPGKESDDEDGAWYCVSLFPDLTGDHIQDARFGYGENGGPAVNFTLDGEGARDFRDLTGRNVGKNLGIIMDERMISAPTLQSEIGKSGRITGMRQEEAQRISALLRSGALRAPLTLEQESKVGASLGQDSICQGVNACVISLILILLFSIIYYRFAGFLAVLALFYNLLLTLVFLAYFKATLTLPGIAGMVLTIGMAIDASILIYERIREEMRGGTDYRRAINTGFSGAMHVILDSNITTFITGMVLFYLGGPAVRGFAVTLMLGVISTVIAGVFFLKSMFDFLLDNKLVKRINV